MARILIVDDEAGLAELIRTLLEDEGYTAEAVHSGQEALDLIAMEAYDLVICDLRMPDIDGLVVCRAVEQRAPPQPAVLLMTGHAEGAAYVSDFPGIRRMDVLARPVGLDELRERVRTMLA